MRRFISLGGEPPWELRRPIEAIRLSEPGVVGVGEGGQRADIAIRGDVGPSRDRQSSWVRIVLGTRQR